MYSRLLQPSNMTSPQTRKIITKKLVMADILALRVWVSTQWQKIGGPLGTWKLSIIQPLRTCSLMLLISFEEAVGPSQGSVLGSGTQEGEKVQDWHLSYFYFFFFNECTFWGKMKCYMENWSNPKECFSVCSSLKWFY